MSKVESAVLNLDPEVLKGVAQRLVDGEMRKVPHFASGARMGQRFALQVASVGQLRKMASWTPDEISFFQMAAGGCVAAEELGEALSAAVDDLFPGLNDGDIQVDHILGFIHAARKVWAAVQPQVDAALN